MTKYIYYNRLFPGYYLLLYLSYFRVFKYIVSGGYCITHPFQTSHYLREYICVKLCLFRSVRLGKLYYVSDLLLGKTTSILLFVCPIRGKERKKANLAVCYTLTRREHYNIIYQIFVFVTVSLYLVT